MFTRLFKPCALGAFLVMLVANSANALRSDIVESGTQIFPPPKPRHQSPPPSHGSKPPQKHGCPSWITWKMTDVIYNSSKKVFIMYIKHTNTSSDRMVMRMYDKKLYIRLTDKNGNLKYSLDYESDTNTEMRLYPGESVIIKYELNIRQEIIDWMNRSDGDRNYIKLYDFKVRDKKA